MNLLSAHCRFSRGGLFGEGGVVVVVALAVEAGVPRGKGDACVAGFVAAESI